MKLITTWILSAALLLGSLIPGMTGEAGGAEAAAMPDQAAQTAAAEAGQTYDAGPAPEELPYAEMEYRHYDPEDFYADAEKLTELADAGDAEGAAAVYDSLYEQIEYLDSMYNLAMIRYYEDFYSSFWSGEYAYTEELWTELADLLATKASYVLTTPVSEAFAAHIGKTAADNYADYEPMTDEQAAAERRELELQDEYYALYDTIDDITYTYRGEDWTIGSLYGRRGDNLYDRDYDGYVEVYYGLQHAMVETFSPIYIELVQMWTGEARDAGYVNYADYAYDVLYGRQYSGEEAQAFCDAVKPFARTYIDELYYSPLYDEALEAEMDTDAESLLSILEEHLARIDPLLEEPMHELRERGLYSIREEESGRYAGSWCTVMNWYDAPFIFITGTGSCFDLITLTHEYGHFCDFSMNPVPDVINSVGDLDLQEIHSNGLQALFTTFYDEIFGRDAEAAAFANISDLLDNVVEGCLYDEFQRRVMEQPEDLTAEQLNSLYVEICADYGFYGPDDLPDWDAGWVYVSHQFDAPVYYISYAASAFAALQLWVMAQDDLDAACQAYMQVLSAGAYGGEGYAEILHRSGLLAFSDEGAVEQVLGAVLCRLSEMER